MPKAKNLKYCRKKARLTQSALADALGVTKATIISWENRKHSIPEPSARRISEYFGVDYTDFCDEDFEKIAQDEMNGKVTLTGEEAQTVIKFRKLPPNVKKLLKAAIDVAYENSQAKT